MKNSHTRAQTLCEPPAFAWERKHKQRTATEPWSCMHRTIPRAHLHTYERGLVIVT
jgi:hypothetical protein